MKTLYRCKTYHDYLEIILHQRQSLGLKKADLAKVMGCQAAYLSQALRGRVDLTEEHLQRLASHLELSDFDTEYLLLLLRLAKAGTEKLKFHLEKLRQNMLNAAEELAPRLGANDKQKSFEALSYYTSSWIPSAIHVATSCEGFQSVKTIAERFGLEIGAVQTHLQALAKHGLVGLEDNKWKYQGGSIHIGKDSSFDHQMQIAKRLLAIQKMPFRKDKDLHYSVTFGTDQATVLRLRSLLLDAIESLHKQVEPSPSEDVYSVNVDLFRA